MPTLWVPNPLGQREYLETDAALYAALFAAARPAVDFARSIAPVGSAAQGDKHPGAYRDSIRVERNQSGVGLRLFSDDPKAHWIEYGAAHTRRQRVLGRAVDHLKGTG